MTTTQTYTVHVPHVPDWVCDLISEVARATGTDEAAATRLALVEGLLYWQRAYGQASGERRAATEEDEPGERRAPS